MEGEMASPLLDEYMHRWTVLFTLPVAGAMHLYGMGRPYRLWTGTRYFNHMPTFTLAPTSRLKMRQRIMSPPKKITGTINQKEGNTHSKDSNRNSEKLRSGKRQTPSSQAIHTTHPRQTHHHLLHVGSCQHTRPGRIQQHEKDKQGQATFLTGVESNTHATSYQTLTHIKMPLCTRGGSSGRFHK